MRNDRDNQIERRLSELEKHSHPPVIVADVVYQVLEREGLIEKDNEEADMSNEIYPLKKEQFDRSLDDGVQHPYRELSVNERLAPIFRALADDPEGWEYEKYNDIFGGKWAWRHTDFLPTGHIDVDNFRLVPKRRTITVEMLKPVSTSLGPGATGLVLGFSSHDEALEAERAIRSAMEGK